MANDNCKYFYAPYLVSNSRFINSEIEEIITLIRNTLIIKLIMRGISYPDCIRKLADHWGIKYDPDEPLVAIEERILRSLCCDKEQYDE